MLVRLVTAIVLVLAGSVVVVLLARALARTMLYPGGAMAVPSGEARRVAYRASDGADLVGLYVRSAQPHAPTVLFFHGNGESAAQNVDLAEALAREGLDVLLAEYRGYGGLAGRPSEAGLFADAAGAVETLRAGGVSGDQLILVGRSLGSGVAAEMATKHPCALLVLVAPYTSIVDLGRRMVGPFAPFFVPDRFDTFSKMASLTCPIVIVHGTADTVVPFSMARRLAQTKRGVRLIAVEGAGHNDLSDLPKLIAAEVRRLPVPTGG